MGESPMTPIPNEADRNFLAYQETASPRYLARVFDLVAGELLLLASHLSRDPHTAEDLVQTTFLEAIKSAQRPAQVGRQATACRHPRQPGQAGVAAAGRKVDPDRVRTESLGGRSKAASEGHLKSGQ